MAKGRRGPKLKPLEAKNWLARLDAAAPKLPPATDWLEVGCSLFMLARYPWLQPPAPAEGDKRKRGIWESGQDTFTRIIEEWTDRIASHPCAQHALKNLDKEQAKQLAALTVQTVDALEEYAIDDRWDRRRSKLLKEMERRNRGLKNRVHNAIRSLERLRDYAGGLDLILGGGHKSIASECLDTLRGLRTYTDLHPNATIIIDGLLGLYKNPADSGTVKLYWFFRHGCDLSGHDSEVRAAIIRNSIWASPESFSPGSANCVATHIHYRPSYRPGESQGSDAVRKLVSRAPLPQGTSQQ